MFNVLICITDHHSLPLVLTAATVCLLATMASLFLYAQVPAFPRWRHWVGIGLTGLVAGSGIWTTHFVAMLAFKTGLPTGYALAPTLASLLVAIVGTSLGFAVASAPASPSRPPAHLALGGLILGLAITAMHYIGMSGYRTEGLVHWDIHYVVASIVIGAAISTVAMAVAPPGSSHARVAAGGLLLTLAIVGMHFTGMTAVTITPDPRLAVPASLLSTPVMAAAAVACTVLIMIAVVGGAMMEAASRFGSLRRLREALDVMPEGIAFFDAADRLIAWNTTYDELCTSRGCTAVAGVSFTDLMLGAIAAGAHPGAIGREEEWIAERLAERRADGSSVVQRTPDGRWLRVTDRRTADGGIVSTRVDITELKRAEAAMADARDQAEELARRAEEAEAIAGLAHWRIDAQTHALTWSNELYRMYGLDRDAPIALADVLGMTHPEDIAATAARIEAQWLTGEPDQNSFSRIRRSDGEVRYLQSNSRVERAEDGTIVALVGTAVDVTEEKLAELALAESEARFRHLAVNAPDMIVECRLDGTMTYVSPASLTVTGYAPEELVGKTLGAFIEPEDYARIVAMCETVFASHGKIAAWPVEFRARNKVGEEVWMEGKPTLALDPTTGRFTGLTDVIRDITPRKTMEAKLRAAQAEAEEAAAVKADFLANMSHELRTPLTSILGFTRLAAEQGDLSQLSRDYIERVSEASRALLCTVNDILDFSKLEAGQVSIQPQPVSLTKLARGTLDLFTPQAGAKDLSLTLDDQPGEDVVVALDPDRIRQVLLNFVSNAVKFTASGGVTLRTRYNEGAERLRVEVIDTGAGIPEEKVDRLFKRFSQIDGSLTRAQGGTGLGLAICKGLVEAMGGEVGVDSRLGEGSRFWFSVPAPRASLREQAAPDQPALEPPVFTGLSVLVVDDHSTNRELAKLFLAGVGAEVVEAEDGEVAVTLAMEQAFDVILMDLRMPRLAGAAATRRIRDHRGPNQSTPILAFTADAEDMDKLAPLGFTDVVAKPIEPMQLISAIARACTEAEAVEFAKAG